MVINGQWNKPIGPGGGTRRLHHKTKVVCQFVLCGGRNRIDKGVKIALLPGIVPPLSG